MKSFDPILYNWEPSKSLLGEASESFIVLKYLVAWYSSPLSKAKTFYLLEREASGSAVWLP